MNIYINPLLSNLTILLNSGSTEEVSIYLDDLLENPWFAQNIVKCMYYMSPMALNDRIGNIIITKINNYIDKWIKALNKNERNVFTSSLIILFNHYEKTVHSFEIFDNNLPFIFDMFEKSIMNRLMRVLPKYLMNNYKKEYLPILIRLRFSNDIKDIFYDKNLDNILIECEENEEDFFTDEFINKVISKPLSYHYLLKLEKGHKIKDVNIYKHFQRRKQELYEYYSAKQFLYELRGINL